MSAVTIEQLAADMAEIKSLLRQLVGEKQSPIMETLRTAELLGQDPREAMQRFRVTRSKKSKSPTKRGERHV